MERYGVSVGAATSPQTTEAGLVWYAVGKDLDLHPRSREVPARALLRGLRVVLSDIDGAAAVTAQLAPSSSGARAISNRALGAAVQSIGFERSGGTTSTTDGVVIWPLDEWLYVRGAQDEAGVLYVGLSLDAGEGTPNLIELTWEQVGSES